MTVTRCCCCCCCYCCYCWCYYRPLVLPHRELFDTEQEAARAYDTAVWRLKPREARNYANFKDSCPPDVAEALKAADKVRLQLCVALCCVLCMACDVAAVGA
jgi:hypothetical protein